MQVADNKVFIAKDGSTVHADHVRVAGHGQVGIQNSQADVKDVQVETKDGLVSVDGSKVNIDRLDTKGTTAIQNNSEAKVARYG